MKWIGIVCSTIGLITSGFMLFNEHHNKVSNSAAANSTTVRPIQGAPTRDLNNLVYLKNRVDEAQNSIDNGD